MWFDLRRQTLAYLGYAPVLYVAEADLPAPRSVVFAALVEPRGWKDWFPGLRDARYTTPPPHGVGTIREANFSGTRWIEEIITWDEPARWAWTVVRATVPLATEQVEAFELTETRDGTHVRWTLALELRLLGRLLSPLTARTIPRLFQRAMANLATRLNRAPEPALHDAR